MSTPLVYTAHLGDLSLDVLVQIYPNGDMTVATRPGPDRRDIRWSVPTVLAMEPPF